MSEGVATGWRGRVSAWWTILRIALEERLVYRGDFALGTLMRFLPIITQIFLWWAVFETVPVGSDGKSRLVGYGFSDMVAYYLLTMLGRAFSSMPGLATGIARQIRDGEVKKYLVQPIDMLGFLFWARVAHKLAYYLWHRLFPLSRVLRAGMAGSPLPGRLHRVAADGVCAWFSGRSVLGAGWILDARNFLAAVSLHAL